MQSRSKKKAQPPGEVNESGYYANLKQTQKDIKTQLQFEKLIYELSTDFINLPIDRIDQKIDDGLELIAKQLGIERIALLQFSPNKSQLTLTHTYAIDSRQRAPIFLVSEQLPFRITAPRKDASNL